MKSIPAYIKTHKLVSGIIIIILICGSYYGYKKATAASTDPTYTIGTVEQGTINSSVTGSGQVQALSSVNVQSLATSQVTSVKVKEGDTVKAGQTIATLDTRNASVSLTQAQASYNKLVNGETSQSLAVSQLSVSQAQTALNNAKQNVLLKLKSEYTTIDNTIRSNIDPVYQNPNSYSPTFGIVIYPTNNNSTATNLNISDSSKRFTLNSERPQLTQIMNTWNAALTSSSDIDSSVAASNNALNQIQPIIEDIYNAVNDIYNTNITYQSQISSYKSQTQAARTAVSNALTDVQSAEQSYVSAQQSFASAQAQYKVTTAAPRSEDLASARASLQAAINTYNNNIIKAPIDGVIGNITIQVGDQAGSATVATIVTKQLVADISLNEIDVANIKVGQKATMTFDAINDLTMTGKVIQIGSIGTVTSGVVNYDVKISMDTNDERIKPGMSVNTSIITDSAQDVVYVPSSAIKTSGNSSYVQAFTTLPVGNNTSSTTITTKELPQMIEVQTGISDDTNTQIISGLTAGQKIITKTTAASATSKTTSSTRSLLGGTGGTGGFGGTRPTGAAR